MRRNEKPAEFPTDTAPHKAYGFGMSKAEILAELPKLTPAELSEIQSRIEDLATYGSDGWRNDCDLTEAEKRLIEARLDDMEKRPEKSIPWAEAQARLKARFGE